MKRKYFIPLLSSIILLLSSCVENSDPFRPGTGGTGTGTGTGGSGSSGGATGTPVDYGHEAIAGEWEIFYFEKTLGRVGNSGNFTPNRYPDRDGFTTKFYGGGTISGNPQKGYFEERNAFGELIINGEYELIFSGTQKKLKTEYKSKWNGADTTATVIVPGMYKEYFTVSDSYTLPDKLNTVTYRVTDLYFYRSKDRAPSYNFPVSSKYHKKNIINVQPLYGDWKFMSYWEKRDNAKYSNSKVEAKFGEVVRFNTDRSFYAYTKDGYDQTAILGPGKFVVVDDVIHAYLQAANSSEKESYLFWLKDPMSATTFREYNKYRSEDSPNVIIEAEGTYQKIK